MSRYRSQEPDPDDDGDWDDSEWDDEDRDDDNDAEFPDGVYADDDEPTVPCPYCGQDLYEGADYCSRCENYISREDAPPDKKPVWLWVGLILALAAALMWVLPF